MQRVEVRQAVNSDKELLFDFIRVNWKERAVYQVPHRWRWLYVDNPFKVDNQLPIWIVVDGEHIVGHTAAMIVPLKIGEEVYPAAWSVNTVVVPEYRGRELGYHLQKANQDAWLVFMSLSMTKANRHIKMKLGGIKGASVSNFVIRFRYDRSKIGLALERRLEKYLLFSGISRAVARILGVVSTVVLNIRLKVIRRLRFFKGRIQEKGRGIRIEEIERFDEALDPILEGFMKPYKVAVFRTSRYLNWKFAEQPDINYRLFLAKSGEQTSGYMILRSGRPELENHYGVIAEFIANPEDRKTMEALLLFATEYFQKENVEKVIISTTVPGFQESFIRFGFRKVSETVPVIYCSDKVCDNATIGDKTDWLLSRGDHDWDQFPSKM